TVLIPAINGTYTIRVVPFNPQGFSITGTISLVPFPAVAPVTSGTAPSFSNHISPPAFGNRAGEPSIGVDWNPNLASLKHDKVNTGGVTFFTSGTQQLRVSFDDATYPPGALWENMAAPVQTGLDPIGFVDHQTGRVFGLELAAGDSNAAFSDNDGMTWTSFVAGGVGQGPDHETFGGGPYNNAASPAPPPHPLYQNAVYYCSQNVAGGAECSRSDNGGLTFGPGVPIFNPVECYGGIHGHVKVSPDGTVYVPNSSCSAGTGSQGVAVSLDNGLTWVDHTVAGSIGSGDPSVGIGSDNTVYIGYTNGDGRPHIAVSTDHGTTWTNDYEVGLPIGCAPGDQYAPCRIKSAVFPVVVAGDGDRAAFGFLGSTTGGNYQDLTGYTGVWHFYVATTYDRGAHWVTVDATPNNPVQVGAICLGGTLCTSHRNLADFNDISVDKEGRSIAAYADGCIICTDASPPANRADNKAAIVRQLDGRRLFAAFDVVLNSVVSRKTHGAAGDFDINLPLIGTREVECRSGGATNDHKLVFTFPNVLTSVAGASVTGGAGMVSSGAIGPNPNQYTVDLTGVTNAQYITVTLSNVHDAASHVGDVSVSMGVLLGDRNANGTVTNADVGTVKMEVASPLSQSNFRSDVNANGIISNADVGAVKGQVSQQLPQLP
ncbi:MAG: sialidase family protein, partial [Limisphaerales bacterium]